MRLANYLAPVTAVLIVCGAASAPGQQSGRGTPPPSQGNAFPLAQSEAAAKAAKPKQTTSPQPNANQAGSSTGKNSPTAQANPFPEAQSKAAAKPDTSNAQSSSSSAAGYSSSDVALPPSAVGQGSLGSHPRMDSYTRDKTEDGRIADDLKVADFYLKNGNYRGALWRYQDALQYAPQDDTALYGVAEAMCKENLTTEAMAHFKSYATSHPQGEYAPKAEKMLAHPNKCKHNW